MKRLTFINKLQQRQTDIDQFLLQGQIVTSNVYYSNPALSVIMHARSTRILGLSPYRWGANPYNWQPRTLLRSAGMRKVTGSISGISKVFQNGNIMSPYRPGCVHVKTKYQFSTGGKEDKETNNIYLQLQFSPLSNHCIDGECSLVCISGTYGSGEGISL